jgi:hypothetical protein
MNTYCLGSVGAASKDALERRLVRSIASNTNVAVSASALNRNKGAIERNTSLLSVKMGALTHNYICIEHRHTNNVGIGSSALDRKYCVIRAKYCIFGPLNLH